MNKKDMITVRLENMLSIYRHMRWDFSYTERKMGDIVEMNGKITDLVGNTADNILYDLGLEDNVSL